MALIAARPGMRRTRAAGWARRLGSFSLMLLLVAVLAHRAELLDTPSFMKVFLLDAAIALLALVCAAMAFTRLWVRGDRVGGDIAVGVMSAVVALVPAAGAAVSMVTHPALIDLSTDTDDPPALLVGQADRGPGANPFGKIDARQAEIQAAAYPAVAGHRYELLLEDAVAAVRQAITEAGWVAGPTDATSGVVTLSAVARSPIFAMPADVAVRVTDEDGTVFVDMRSVSRYGRHDLGDNAARIDAFYRSLDTIAASQAPAAQ